MMQKGSHYKSPAALAGGSWAYLENAGNHESAPCRGGNVVEGGGSSGISQHQQWHPLSLGLAEANSLHAFWVTLLTV